MADKAQRAGSAMEVSVRQREIREREDTILSAARDILFREGYHAMTMARIAEQSECPRGTIYQQFTSRDDVLVALACKSWENRLAMIRRGMAYAGPARERMAAVAEGVALFFHLFPADFALLYKAVGPICENASSLRLEALGRAEQATAEVVRSLLDEACTVGELTPTWFTLDEVTLALHALAEGGFALNQFGFSKSVLSIADPTEKLWLAFNTLADAYGWRPLTHERDWVQVLADIRRTVFPDESQSVYGAKAWYGWHGDKHPRYRRPGIIAQIKYADSPETGSGEPDSSRATRIG